MKPKTPFQSEIDAIEIGQLIHQKLSGVSLTSAQADKLEEWLAIYDPDQTMMDHFVDQNYDEKEVTKTLSKYPTSDSLQRVLGKIKKARSVRIKRLIGYGAAASLLVGTVLFAGIWLGRSAGKEEINLADLSPGSNKAILVLPDGKQLNLSQDNETVVLSESQFTYEDGTRILDLKSEFAESSEVAVGTYASLITPKGGQYQLRLPDGSRVWLNAASTLRYPLVFDNGARIAELEGEAYFEIKPAVTENGEKIPFLVKTKGQVIEVLGTSFNVLAYEEDEQTITTLLEGSVRVQDERTGSRLDMIPGEQVLLSEGRFIKQQADVELNVAWKEGFFQFKRADIQTVMREISRWYDVDVRYEGVPDDISITGKTYRNVNASQALEILQHLDIPFRIEKNEIVITKRKH